LRRVFPKSIAGFDDNSLTLRKKKCGRSWLLRAKLEADLEQSLAPGAGSAPIEALSIGDDLPGETNHVVEIEAPFAAAAVRHESSHAGLPLTMTSNT
jgi:hypothetical protein